MTKLTSVLFHTLMLKLYTKVQRLINIQCLRSEGPTGLLKKQNVRADYAFKLEVVRDVEENNITLLDASLKYNASASQIKVWLKVARTQGYDALAITRPRGRPPKNAMGRSRKKKPEEMTELERLRYENECLRAEVTIQR